MEITRFLCSTGFSVTQQTVVKHLKKIKTTGFDCDAPRSGHPSEGLTGELLNFVDAEMEMCSNFTSF